MNLQEVEKPRGLSTMYPLLGMDGWDSLKKEIWSQYFPESDINRDMSSASAKMHLDLYFLQTNQSTVLT